MMAGIDNAGAADDGLIGNGPVGWDNLDGGVRNDRPDPSCLGSMLSRLLLVAPNLRGGGSAGPATEIVRGGGGTPRQAVRAGRPA